MSKLPMQFKTKLARSAANDGSVNEDVSTENGFWRRATPDEQAANERQLVRLLRLFPRLPKRDVYDFLVSCTAYPFNSLQAAVDQAAELSRLAHKSVQRAYLESDRIMERAMRQVRRKYPEHFQN